MTQETALAQRDRFDVPERAVAERKFQAIKAFQALVQSQMIPGLDYGVIPGTQRPTLLKPGAEKIVKLMGLADTYEVLHETKDWDKPFFEFVIRCRLSDSHGVISEGLGECNSMEARYRWREAKPRCPRCGNETVFKAKQGQGWFCWAKRGGCGANFPAGDPAIESQPIGRVPNEDVYSQVNTILKMARKRALVDAALSAGRLSDVFTQDLEDMLGGAEQEEDETTGPQAPVARTGPSDAPTRTQSPPAGPEAPQRAKTGHAVAASSHVAGVAPTLDGIRNAGDVLNYLYRVRGIRNARATVASILGKDVSALATTQECQEAARLVDAVLAALGKDVAEATDQELAAAIAKAKGGGKGA